MFVSRRHKPGPVVEGLFYTFDPSHQLPEGDSVLFFVGGITLRDVEDELIDVLDDGDAKLVDPRRAVETVLVVAIGVFEFRP